MSKKVDYGKFLNMDRHQDFLDQLYRGKGLAAAALDQLEDIPFKGFRVRRAIKQLKNISTISHMIYESKKNGDVENNERRI